MELKKVIFEPHPPTHTKVTAERSDGKTDLVHLDNVSAGTGMPSF